jgi:branched-chain amino acid transport system ATP-binding protein
MAALLETRGLKAFYGPVQVLHGLDISVEEGGITALLGANGAGKTTALRALCAMIPSQGAIHFGGAAMKARRTEDIVRLGIRRQQAGTLSGGEQQMLAISRALMLRPRLLLLDEPSFGLAPIIVKDIFRILRAINREDRVSMLIVEQNANLALDLADHAFLIETGRVAIGGPAEAIKSDDSVRRSYLGY